MSRKKLRAAGMARGAMGKSIVRTASKSMEKNIVQRAKKLYDNPYVVLPDYSDKYSEKVFKKLAVLIKKIDAVKDDQKKLEKFALKRNLPAAIAGTLLIAHTEKTPYLAAASLPTGTVNYAQRGNASKDDLISVQYHQDPFLRLLGIRDLALSRGLHIYSWDDGFVSTGIHPNPPDAFIDFDLQTLKLKRKNRITHCSHLSVETISKKDSHQSPYIHIYWKSAKATIGICKDCLQQTQNTFFLLTKYLIAPNVSEDFEVNVIGTIIQKQEQENKDTSYLDEYFEGKLTDLKLIDKNMSNRKEALQQQETTMFILDGKAYDSAEEFIKALHPNTYEEKALTYFIKRKTQPLIVDDVTPNAVIELFWEDYGYDFLKSVLENEDIAKELHELHDTPSAIVKTAFEYQKQREILNVLPRYTSLPPIASYLNQMARTYRVSGKQKLILSIKEYPDTPKGKALAYALYIYVGKASDKKWKFSKIETESGEFVLPYITTLLECDPSEYHTSLLEVLKMIGVSENFEPL